MKWDTFDANFREYLKKIRKDNTLFDVTLVTDDGKHKQAHKIILSAGSHLFCDIFQKSSPASMLIYLKGIKSPQLEQILDFIYNGEAYIEQEELKQFLETGKELQVKDFEVDLSGVGESVLEDPVRYSDEKEDIFETRDSTIKENTICDTQKPPVNHSFETDKGIIQTKTDHDLNLQIRQMIENTGGGTWKCKVCGKTAARSSIRKHAETHIEGMSHSCQLCNKTFSNRQGLKVHIRGVHSEVVSCDICGRSELNRKSLSNHMMRQHSTLSKMSLKCS